MSNHTFTVEEILNAAEKNKYKNYNDDYIAYSDGSSTENNFDSIEEPKRKVIMACVIGEAFLNLGLVENGTDARQLSYALEDVRPDKTIEIPFINVYKERDYMTFYNLSEFINTLNSYNGYRGKKRLVKLARKYFSKSLKQKVTF